MKKINLVSVFILLFLSTLVGQNRIERKKLKEETSKKEYYEIKELVESKMYKFEVHRVNPVRSSPIVLRGDGYHLTLAKDSLDTYLPYFGVRYAGGGIGESGGIEMKGHLEEYEVEYDEKRHRITVKFIGRNKSERFDMTLSIFKNGNSSLSVSSMERSTISYSGKVVPQKRNPKKTSGKKYKS